MSERRETSSRGDAENAEVDLDKITGAVIDTAMRIHKGLGPGLLESVYEAVLARDLEEQGFCIERQKVVEFDYNGMTFSEGLRVDLLVNDCVIVELKSVEHLAPVHGKQLLTYLRLMRLPVGLLLNFGGATLKEGLRRIVNNLSPSASPRLRVNQPENREPGSAGEPSRGEKGCTMNERRETSSRGDAENAERRDVQ